MGVKLLNTFLRKKYPRVIREIHWRNFYGKKIVIDTNNYIYKFLSEDNLLGGFIRMCDLFKYFNILPLFIFDGKPSKEKREEINHRKKTRQKMKKFYDKNKDKISKKSQIECKRKIVKVTHTETQLVQNILTAYGMKFIKAPGESDILCCKLVKDGKFDACLSEDMDMFAYGCPIVLRCYTDINTIMMYNLNYILICLKLNLETFKYLTILANLKNKEKNHTIFYYYKKYLKFIETNSNDPFINYLLNCKIISFNEFISIKNDYEYYNLDNSDILSKCPYILIKSYPLNKFAVRKFKQKLLLE